MANRRYLLAASHRRHLESPLSRPQLDKTNSSRGRPDEPERKVAYITIESPSSGRHSSLPDAAEVETILEKENFTLEELLDENEIIQECEALNSRLICL
ncbi:hypothetical protein Droror1_Dr00027650 [Drosera rotundifolia]